MSSEEVWRVSDILFEDDHLRISLQEIRTPNEVIASRSLHAFHASNSSVGVGCVGMFLAFSGFVWTMNTMSATVEAQEPFGVGEGQAGMIFFMLAGCVALFGWGFLRLFSKERAIAIQTGAVARTIIYQSKDHTKLRAVMNALSAVMKANAKTG